MRVPDLGVSCTPDAPGQQALPDPVVLIEILSPGNARETWENLWSYTTIPSVLEIAVVHPTRMLVEMLRRGTDGHWPEGPGGRTRRQPAPGKHRLRLPAARGLRPDAPRLTARATLGGCATGTTRVAKRELDLGNPRSTGLSAASLPAHTP
jgi:hypothetical protein